MICLSFSIDVINQCNAAIVGSRVIAIYLSKLCFCYTWPLHALFATVSYIIIAIAQLSSKTDRWPSGYGAWLKLLASTFNVVYSRRVSLRGFESPRMQHHFCLFFALSMLSWGERKCAWYFEQLWTDMNDKEQAGTDNNQSEKFETQQLNEKWISWISIIDRWL